MYSALLAASADPKRAADFVEEEFRPGATKVVIQERDPQRLKGTLPGNGYSLTLDAFTEFGDRARISTRGSSRSANRRITWWTIAGQERLSAIENLYRLALNGSRQFDARNLSIRPKI